MTDTRARINDARQRTSIAELNRIMDEVDAELGHKAPEPIDPPTEVIEPELDPKTVANNLTVNGRTGGHKPQIKKAARYIDATLR